MTSKRPHLDDLTVFVISCAEDTLDDCVDALNAQDCTFHLKHIVDVSPMSRAFQSMPDRCKTPYFVQVDADMILKPHAVRSMYEGAQNTWFFTCIVFGQLYEEGFGPGGTVRLWKKNLFRFFSFRDRRTVDRDLFKRIRMAGFRRKQIDGIVGIHRPRHSDFSSYLKAKSDVEKWRFLGRPFEMYAKKLFAEAKDGLPESSHQFIGALLGAITVRDRYVRSKDLGVETRRHDNLCSLLMSDGRLPPFANDAADDSLIQLAARCYSDFRNQDSKARDDFARKIVDALADDKAGEIDLNKFIETASG